MRFVVPDDRRIRLGTYRAVLAGLAARATGRVLVWTFAVQGPHGTTTLTATSSPHFGAGTPARAWAEALLNRELAPGEVVESGDLLGRPCLVVVLELLDGSAHVVQVHPVVEE